MNRCFIILWFLITSQGRINLIPVTPSCLKEEISNLGVRTPELHQASHCSDGETEAVRWGTCTRSHSRLEGLEPASPLSVGFSQVIYSRDNHLSKMRKYKLPSPPIRRHLEGGLWTASVFLSAPHSPLSPSLPPSSGQPSPGGRKQGIPATSRSR